MKRLFLSLMIGVLLLSLWMAACKPEGPPPPQPPPVTTAAPIVPGRETWEENWNKIVAEAKKEGRVTIYAEWGPKVRQALTEGFKKDFGIEVEFVPVSRPPEIAERMAREQRAGLYLADVVGTGFDPIMTLLKPAGVLGTVKPLLIRQDVLEPKGWRGGSVPFPDAEAIAVPMIETVIRLVLYNTNLIREGELTSVKDLLKPIYKGKVIIDDSTGPGAGNTHITHLDIHLWGEAETVSFYRKLIKEQEAVVQRDRRLPVESVARGKYLLALSPRRDVVEQFVSEGTPVKYAMCQEDNLLTVASGVLAVPIKMARPNAGTLFVNWLLTRDGQSLFAPAFGGPSARIDASTKGIDSLVIPVAGTKYYPSTTMDFISAQGKWLGLAKKIIEESLR